MTDSEAFLREITGLYGLEYEIREIDSTKPGLPPVSCHIFRNVPEPGMTTAVTYGLSEADHPDWKFGKPELVLTVKSDDKSWALAMAFLAERFRGDQSFAYGSLFGLNDPICPASKMCGFFVQAPAILDQASTKIQLPTKTVNLSGMYPIYGGEIELIHKIGLEKFWHLPEFDAFDVKRPDLSK